MPGGGEHVGFDIAVWFALKAFEQGRFRLGMPDPAQGQEGGQAGFGQGISQGSIQRMNQRPGGGCGAGFDPHVIAGVEKSPQNGAALVPGCVFYQFGQFGEAGFAGQFEPGERGGVLDIGVGVAQGGFDDRDGVGGFGGSQHFERQFADFGGFRR